MKGVCWVTKSTIILSLILTAVNFQLGSSVSYSSRNSDSRDKSPRFEQRRDAFNRDNDERRPLPFRHQTDHETRREFFERAEGRGQQPRRQETTQTVCSEPTWISWRKCHEKKKMKKIKSIHGLGKIKIRHGTGSFCDCLKNCRDWFVRSEEQLYPLHPSPPKYLSRLRCLKTQLPRASSMFFCFFLWPALCGANSGIGH